jgi:hypothetical protein
VNQGLDLAVKLGATGVKGANLILGSTLPVVAEEIADQFGVGPTGKAVIGGLTLLLTGLMGKTTPAKEIDNLFSQSRKIAAGKSIDAASFIKRGKALIERLKVGGVSPEDKIAIGELDKIFGRVKNGRIGVDELMSFKVKLNRARGRLFRKDLGKAGVKSARSNLNAVSAVADGALNKFGSENPAFKKVYSQANRLFSEVANVPKAIRFLENKVDLANNDPITNAFLLLNPAAFAKTFGTAKAANFLQKMLLKPNIRRLYVQSLGEALSENLAGVSKKVAEFDRAVRKEKKQIK